MKIWDPGTDSYDDYGSDGTPPVEIGDLSTVTPKWVPTEDAGGSTGKFDVDAALLAKQAASTDLTDLVARWIPASSSGGAGLSFAEDTDNGTDVVVLGAPASVTTTRILSLPDATGVIATNIDIAGVQALRHGKIVGQYYQDTGGASTTAAAPTLNRMLLIPKILPAGTLDRLGIEVSTLEATSVVRVGVYAHDASTCLPTGAPIAEGTSGADTYPLDASGTGNKVAAISAVLPTFGLYWWAFVVQTASSAVRFRTVVAPSTYSPPLGTSAPSTGANVSYVRHQSSVTGALPTIGTIATGETLTPPRFFYRYSA